MKIKKAIIPAAGLGTRFLPATKAQPKEMLAGLPVWFTILGFVVVGLLVWGCVMLLRWVTPRTLMPLKGWRSRLKSLLYLPLGALLFLGMRGSVSESTANPSYAYFSNDYPFCNHAALNPTFNMFHSLFKMQDLAKEFDVKPIGTFAHEWFMGIQGENVRLSEVQKTALDIWAKEYRGELGIALSDIFGFNAFLRDFDKYFSKLFDGCRHDSGSPFTWGEMLIDHYKKLGLDPLTKTGCWSDSLNADKCVEIAKRFSNRIKVSFGVGTSITNSLGITLSFSSSFLARSNGHPVCKLSDAPGKGMCHSQNYIDYCKSVYDYRSIDE